MGKLTHTVKGPIASFRSADIAPIESLKLHFLPKQEGSGDPSPTNIRPITGWTGVNGRKASKNLLPNNIVNGTEYSQGLKFVQNSDGSITITGTATNTTTKLAIIKNFPSNSFPLKAGTYRPHLWATEPNDYLYMSIMYNETSNSMWAGAKGGSYSYTIAEDVFVSQIRIGITAAEGVQFNVTIYPSLEIGSTPTSFEDCKGELIPITFPDGQTIYGGYIDPVAGEIVAEYVSKICDGTENGWNTNSTSGSNTRFHIQPSRLGLPKPVNSSTSLAKFSYFNSSTSSSAWNGFIGSTGNVLFFVPTDTASTVAEWKEYLSEHNLQICYKLEIPIHIPIPAEDMKTFLDYNNFWSDTNDDTEVEYAFADRLSERKLIMDTPHIASASGSVASFNTDLKAPIVDLKAHFTPVQEGSGDPSPVNKRAIKGYSSLQILHSKKNLAKLSAEILSQDRIQSGITFHALSDSSVHIEGTATQDAFLTNGYFKGNPYLRLLKAGTYTLTSNFPNSIASGSVVYMYGYDIEGNNLGTFATAYDTKNPAVFTLQKDAYVNIQMIVKSGATINHDVWVQIEKGSIRTDYEQHVDEVIPIEFPATKNLLDAFQYGAKSGAEFEVSEGSWYFGRTYTDNSTYIKSTQVFGAGTYTLNAKIAESGIRGFRLLCSSPTCGGTWNNYYGSYFIDSYNNYSKITFTCTEEFTIGIVILNAIGHGGEPAKLYDIQLERGSTATAYEPYGTVYGGYVDLVRGKIVYEWKKIILDGTEDWYDYGDSMEGYSFKLGGQVVNDRILGYQVSKCSMFNNVDGCWGYGYKNDIAMYSDHPTVKPLYFRSPDGIVTTLSEFKQWLSENKPELCYKLATPIEYDITPQILKTLKGTNNIWADTNGNVDVKYWTH